MEELKTKHNAISFYKSQIEYNPWYLFTFARRNELFGDFPAIKLSAEDSKEIIWHDLEAYQSIEIDLEHKKDTENSIAWDVAYAASDNKLLVRFEVKKEAEMYPDVSIFLFGYSRKVDFSKMPKLYIKADTLGVHVRDKKQLLQVKDIEFEAQNNTLILKIPLKLLGNPDRILTSARTYPNKLPLDETSWRTLYLQ
ncbi:MAG: hypothetical protein NTV71_01645 [Candidatus Omnitrophica bacterium]|nr:hypothetical protein [Candidatus Omnitrophota bacterium]